MASLIKKVKGGKPYYYIAVSKRVNGKPRIVHQTYLGSVDRIRAVFSQKTAAEPVGATLLELGLPGALWQAAQDSGACAALDAVWTPPREGPALSHFLLLAAFHRICNPDPNTKVADWYERTVLPRLWDFPSADFSSRAFADRFDSIEVAPAPSPGQPETDDELFAAQDSLLQAFRDRRLVSQRVLAYNTTNFHARIASDNEPGTPTPRDHNEQERRHVRKVGLSYALDATHGLSLMHYVHPANVTVSNQLPEALDRIAGRLDRAGIPRDTVTLTIDEGSAAMANIVALERSGLDWVAALPWNQVPPELRQRPLAQMAPVGPTDPGAQAAAERCLVHGTERLCVLLYSASAAAEQLYSVSDALTKAMRKLTRLTRELAEPQPHLPTEERVHQRVREALDYHHVPDLVQYELIARDDHWELSFQNDLDGFRRLSGECFGRTVLVTNRDDWSAAEVVEAYCQQQHAERVFRNLDGGAMVDWSLDCDWTDSKLKVHAFCSMLGVSLLHYLHRRVCAAGWSNLTLEEMCEELRDVQQIDLHYAPVTKRSKPQTVTVPSSQSLTQQGLVQALGIDRLLPQSAAKGARK